MPISDELKRIYVTAPNDDYYIETLSLYHVNLSGGVRYITNQEGGWSANLEDGTNVFYEYLPFVVVPPDMAEQAALSMKVGIDNTSRNLMDELELLSESPTDPITLKYRVYLESDDTTVQNNPPLILDIQSVTASQDSVSFNAGMTNLRSRPFPSILYSTELFPGLKR